MIIEKILYTIEKYVCLDILLMILGLIYSSDGMRGYPFTWYAGGSSDPGRFLMSLTCVTLVVLAGDMITRTAIRFAEPTSNVQRTIDKYVSTYTEYEDPLVADVKQNTSVRSSGNKSGSYADKMSEDYANIRRFLNKQDKEQRESGNNNTVIVKNLLNGSKPEFKAMKKNKSSSSIAWWIFFIVLAILFMYW